MEWEERRAKGERQIVATSATVEGAGEEEVSPNHTRMMCDQRVNGSWRSAGQLLMGDFGFFELIRMLQVSCQAEIFVLQFGT